MSFLKKLFSKNNPEKNTSTVPESSAPATENPQPLTPTEQKFKDELYHSLKRYFSDPDIHIELGLTDKKGNALPEHLGLDVTFKEWKEIRSFWDRMGVFYKLWDTSEFNKLSKWQIIQRYVNDRRALEAHDYFKKNITPEDYMDIRLPIAISKMFRSLTSYETAKYYAERAYELRPDLNIVKTELASVLHLSENEQDREKAHSIIHTVLEEKIKAHDGNEVGLLNFFMFGGGYIDSSVFAAIYLHAGNCDLDTWDIMADEYYYCPHFRYEHALVLHKNNETMRMLAKLDSLANEFPWFKKAVNTYIDAIRSFRESSGNPDFFAKEMAKMEEYKSMWKA